MARTERCAPSGGEPWPRKMVMKSGIRILFIALCLSAGSANAADPLQLTSVVPEEVTGGKTYHEFQVVGNNLRKVTAFKFMPSEGITVTNLRATNHFVIAEVTFPLNFFGEVRVAAVSGDRQSNDLKLMVLGVDPSFIVANPKMDAIDPSKLREALAACKTVTVPISLDFKDPTGQAGKGWLRLHLEVGRPPVSSSPVVKSDEEGVNKLRVLGSPDQTSGRLVIDFEWGIGIKGFPKPKPMWEGGCAGAGLWLEFPAGSDVPFTVALETSGGRMSNKVTGVLKTPVP